MGVLGWLAWRVVRLLVDLTVVLLVFVLLPGIPPHVPFATFDELKPPLPMEGALAKNNRLDAAQRIMDGKITGPESIASRGPEEIFVSLHGGKILKIWGPRFDHFKIVASIGPGCDGPWQENVCGRPLGLRFAPDGRLLVADAYLGLFSVDVETGEKESLFDITQEIDGAVAMLPDDLDIDKDGFIYWSDASSHSTLMDSIIEVMSSPSGRILKFDPKTGTNTVLVRGMHFANGVQLSPDHDFLLFAESLQYRVHRHWLRGPKAGQTEIFVDRLPGSPDNIRPKEDGGYYISIVSTPSEEIRKSTSVLARLPLLRKLILRLMVVTKMLFETLNKIYPNVHIEKLASSTLGLHYLINSKPPILSLVVVVDEEGRIVDSLQGDTGKMGFISETQRVGDSLFFGSPFNKFLGRLVVDSPSMEVEGQGVRMKTGVDEDEGESDSEPKAQDQVEGDEEKMREEEATEKSPEIKVEQVNAEEGKVAREEERKPKETVKEEEKATSDKAKTEL